MDTTIRRITIRRCDPTTHYKGRYTTGDVDPDIVQLVTEISNGSVSGFGECVPTSLYYEEGHIGRSAIDEWVVIQEMASGLLGKDCRLLSNWLSEKTGTSVQYAVFDRSTERITVLQKAEHEETLHVVGYGADITKYANRHVLGKLILAYCGDEEKAALLAHCMPEKLMAQTLLPGPELDCLLDRIRECGHAEDSEESGRHVFRTGLPVFANDGSIVGSISCAWFASEFDADAAAAYRKELEGIVEFLSLKDINRRKDGMEL